MKEGVWFNAAYSASPVCAPARAALLTGRHPHRTGVVTLEMNTHLEMTRIRSDERNATVHFTDLFPTLVAICRLRPPVAGRRLDGVSLEPMLFDGIDTISVPRFWQWNRAHPNYTHNAALREGPWKLVRPFVTRGENPPDSAEVPVLYHLATDPFETIDLAQQHPERAARMRAALDAWSAEVERERQHRD